jgi:hypothetical protein
LDCRPLEHKVAGERSRPKVEFLFDRGQVAFGDIQDRTAVLRPENQSNGSEVNPVRVRNHPLLHWRCAIEHILDETPVVVQADAGIVIDI